MAILLVKCDFRTVVQQLTFNLLKALHGPSAIAELLVRNQVPDMVFNSVLVSKMEKREMSAKRFTYAKHFFYKLEEHKISVRSNAAGNEMRSFVKSKVRNSTV